MRVQVVAALTVLVSACGPELQPSEQGSLGSPRVTQHEKEQMAAPPKPEDEAPVRPASQAASAAPLNLPPAVEPTVTAADWDEMIRCGHVYASLERSYVEYFGAVIIPPLPANQFPPEYKTKNAILKGSRDAKYRLGDAAKKLRDQNEWNQTQDSKVAPPFVARLHETTAACDRKFGFQVATILPPLKPFASKPTMSLKGIDATVIDCAKVGEVQKTLRDEIAFVRSERVRLGDASIFSAQLTDQEALRLVSGIRKRLGPDKCFNPSMENDPEGFHSTFSEIIGIFPE